MSLLEINNVDRMSVFNKVTFIQGLAECSKCDDDWECSICLNNKAVIPTIVKTSCGHLFHKTCMQNLKDSQPQPSEHLGIIIPCPLCRKNIYID